jgi:hypothetical protein
MPPCYGAPRRARVRTGLWMDRRSVGDGEARGAWASKHNGALVGLGKERGSGGVRPRSAVASSADAEVARARGRDVVSQNAVGTSSFC